MKSLLVAVLVAVLPTTVRAQCDETMPEAGGCGGPTDAPLVFEADGVTLKKGKSIRIEEGQLAAFAGRLIDPQESVRRERMNTRNEVELKTLKTGNVILSTPAFIAIIVGVVAASAAASVGIVKATEKKP